MDQRKADYLTYGQADWHLGFAVVYVRNGISVPQLVPMRPDGSFTFEREEYHA